MTSVFQPCPVCGADIVWGADLVMYVDASPEAAVHEHPQGTWRVLPPKVDTDKEPWQVIFSYGNFTEPTSGRNFVVVRLPRGRRPWAKRIAPAIDRLLRPWFPSSTRRSDRFWNVDGEDEVYISSRRLWDTNCVPTYEWNGTELVLVRAILRSTS